MYIYEPGKKNILHSLKKRHDFNLVRETVIKMQKSLAEVKNLQKLLILTYT